MRLEEADRLYLGADFVDSAYVGEELVWFDPASFGALELYLDARWPSGRGVDPPADGAGVATWVDLSGNGHDVVQADAADRPLFRSADPNLLSFNQATQLTDLADSSSYQCTSVKTNAADAQYAGRYVACTATATALEYRTNQTNRAAVTVGQTYTAMVSVKAPSITRNVSVVLDWYDVGGVLLGGGFISTPVALTTSWQTLTVTGVAPAGAVTARVAVQLVTTAVAEVFHAGQFGLFAGTVSTWLPPTTLPGGLPTLQFDSPAVPARNIHLQAANAADWTWPQEANGEATVYVVCSMNGANGTNFQNLVCTNLGDSAYQGWQLELRGGGNTRGAQYKGVSAQFNTSLVAGVIWTTPAQRVLSMTFGVNETLKIYIDGTLIGTSAAPTGINPATGGASRAVFVGNFHTGYESYVNVSAVLIYSESHDAATRGRIEDALGAIFGITVA